MPTLSFWDGLRAVRLKLWDEDRGRLVTFAQARAVSLPRLLEHEPVVVQQLALEADAVGAHTGGEGEPEVGARRASAAAAGA